MEGYMSELLTKIHELNEKYDKTNEEAAIEIYGVAAHFAWYAEQERGD